MFAAISISGEQGTCVTTNQSKEALYCKIDQEGRSRLTSWRKIPNSIENWRIVGAWERSGYIFKSC